MNPEPVKTFLGKMPIAVPVQATQRIRYVIATPARNEGREIEETIQSVIRQSVLPCLWVIIDDGSTDETGRIADDYARRFTWIKVVHREDRGFRNPGGGVIEAVMDGLRTLGSADWDFLVKLDADLVLEEDYFERCFRHFSSDPQLGIGGGTVYSISNGRKEIDANPMFHVRGATKIYRRGCWQALGGLVPAPGWDTLDEVKANMMGWRTRTFSDVSVRQRRSTGSNDGAWRENVKNGRSNFISGYHPLFMFLKCLKRVVQRPYLLASLGLAYGYISSCWKGISRVDDPSLIRYLRTQQMQRLLFRETIWK